MSLWLLKAASGTALGLLQFALAIIIAGILMANARGSGNMAKTLLVRLAGERGAGFADIATKTVRNVVKGILGVAIIQALLVSGLLSVCFWPLFRSGFSRLSFRLSSTCFTVQTHQPQDC